MPIEVSIEVSIEVPKFEGSLSALHVMSNKYCKSSEKVHFGNLKSIDS